jgi:Tfp pilus assembly protein PilV
MKTSQKGQSIVELVFAIVLLILFITGAVMALITAVSTRGESLARKKAARLAETVMEEITGQKVNNSEDFWKNQISSTPSPVTEEGYTYQISYSLVGNSGTYPNCAISSKNCVNAKVTVTWKRKTDSQLELKKFFGKGV